MNFLKTTALSLALTVFAIGSHAALDDEQIKKATFAIVNAPELQRISVAEQHGIDALALFGGRTGFRAASNSADFAEKLKAKLLATSADGDLGDGGKGKSAPAPLATAVVSEVDQVRDFLTALSNGTVADPEAEFSAKSGLFDNVLKLAQNAEIAERERDIANESLRKTQGELRRSTEEFSQKSAQLQAEKKFFRDDAGRLKSECERAAGDVSDLNRRLDAANEGLKTANEELSRLKDSATVSQADFDDAKRLKGLAEAEVARLQGELQAAQDDAAAKELARTQAATKATELETALNDAHAKIADILGKTANPSDFENDLDELINQGNEIISKSKEVQTLLAKDGEDPSTFDPMTRLGEIKETVGALVDETNPTNGTLVDNLNAVSAKVDAYRDVVDGWTTLQNALAAADIADYSAVGDEDAQKAAKATAKNTAFKAFINAMPGFVTA